MINLFQYHKQDPEMMQSLEQSIEGVYETLAVSYILVTAPENKYGRRIYKKTEIISICTMAQFITTQI